MEATAKPGHFELIYYSMCVIIGMKIFPSTKCCISLYILILMFHFSVLGNVKYFASFLVLSDYLDALKGVIILLSNVLL